MWSSINAFNNIPRHRKMFPVTDSYEFTQVYQFAFKPEGVYKEASFIKTGAKLVSSLRNAKTCSCRDKNVQQPVAVYRNLVRRMKWKIKKSHFTCGVSVWDSRHAGAEGGIVIVILRITWRIAGCSKELKSLSVCSLKVEVELQIRGNLEFWYYHRIIFQCLILALPPFAKDVFSFCLRCMCTGML